MNKYNTNIKKISRTIGATLLVLSLIIGVTSNKSLAQSSDDFRVYAQSAPKGVMLVIEGPALHKSSASQTNGWTGYNIYRHKKGDSLQELVTESPLSRIGSFSELRAIGKEGVDGMVTFIGATDTTDLWNMIVTSDERIQSLEFLLKPFRKLMGHLLVDTLVSLDSTYVYYCAQVDSAGKESAPSDTVEVTVGVPMFPLLGPNLVEVETGDKQVTLKWTANPDDSGAFSFNVYRSADSASFYQRLNREEILALRFGDDDTQAPEMKFIDSTVFNQRTYYYAVVSADYAGNESERQVILARAHDNSPPAKPENVLAIGEREGIRITWEKSPDNDVIGYNIFRSIDADSQFTQVNTAPTPNDSAYYIDYSATLHRDYYYRVTALDKAGNESDRSAQAIAMFHTPVRPLPPNGLKTEPDSSAVKLSWQIIPDTLVRGYYIYRARSWGSDFTQVSALIIRDDSTWTDTTYGLSPRGTYMYAMRSVTYSDQYSPYTEAVSGSPLAKPDEAPQAPQSFFGHADIDGNRLFWTPSSDNSVFGYNIYRAPASDNTNAVRLNALPVMAMTGHFTDTTATSAATSFTYWLRSVTSDNREGQPSHPVTISRAIGALLPPGGIRCLNYGDSIRVVWNITNQDNVDGYRLYRRSAVGAAKLISGSIIAKDKSAFPDKDVRSGIRYYYSLSAVGANGSEGIRSREIEVLTK